MTGGTDVLIRVAETAPAGGLDLTIDADQNRDVCALDVLERPGSGPAARSTPLPPVLVRAGAEVPGVGLHELWTGRAGLLRVCRAVGLALADLHRHAATPARPAPVPWVLTDAVPDGTPALVARASREPEIRRALAPLGRRWEAAGGWVHGDLLAADVRIDTGVGVCARKACEVRVIDRGLSGAGAPGWDLAAVIDVLAWTAEGWRLRPATALATFGDAYRTAGGPARPSAAWNCARALHRAASPGCVDQVDVLLDRARAAARKVRHQHTLS